MFVHSPNGKLPTCLESRGVPTSRKVAGCRLAAKSRAADLPQSRGLPACRKAVIGCRLPSKSWLNTDTSMPYHNTRIFFQITMLLICLSLPTLFPVTICFSHLQLFNYSIPVYPTLYLVLLAVPLEPVFTLPTWHFLHTTCF